MAPQNIAPPGVPLQSSSLRYTPAPTLARDNPAQPSLKVTSPGAQRPVVGATTSEAQLRSRMQQLKRQRNRRWDWLRKLPGYELMESIWLRFTQVRDAGEETSEDQHKRELPAWMVSFLVHVTLLLVLALIPIAQMAAEKFQVFDGSFVPGGQGAIEFTPVPAGTDVSLEAIDLPMSSIVLNAPDLQFDSSAISSSLTQTSKTSEGPATALEGLDVSNGLAGRTGSLKGALLGKFGGNGVTQAAVAAGLKWLAYNQKPDGGWSLKGPYNDGASNEDRTAATAMALNAFLGDGHTHKAPGEYQSVVERGLKFLLRRQDKEGFFAGGEPSHNQAYSQAIATITVCEAYGMTGDSQLKVPASRAIKYAEWSQGRQKGWRYEPREDSDLSVTGWYLMALMTGKMAGLEPNEKIIRSVGDYLESVAHEYGSRYAYQRQDKASLSMTAEGLLCRQYLGWPSSHPALLQAIETDLLPNAPDAKAPMYSVYFWYYATQVLHHVGGKAWTEWNDQMKVVLPGLQETKGVDAGSWDPFNDQFGPSGGRLYTTCFCIYCLEVYYRHLALYDLKPEVVQRTKPRDDPPSDDQKEPDANKKESEEKMKEPGKDE